MIQSDFGKAREAMIKDLREWMTRSMNGVNRYDPAGDGRMAAAYAGEYIRFEDAAAAMGLRVEVGDSNRPEVVAE